MFNNIQIYLIKAEDPMINNTSIGKQMHIAKEEETEEEGVWYQTGTIWFCDGET